MKNTRRVFISSTSEDLEAYRTAARDAVLLAGCQPVMMEYFTPQGQRKPYATCMDEVASCDLLIAIVAHRYGWTPDDQPNAGKKSITWLECERAKHAIAFVHDDEKHPWPEKYKESYRLSEAVEKGTFTPELAAEVQRNVASLKEFKSWLSSRGFWWEFTTPDQLATGVLRALTSGTGEPGDPSKFLAWLREQTAWIDIRGLQVGAGRAYRFPIQELYIPLRTRGGAATLEETLATRRLVIVGDPGSGKTTFLRRLAFEACTASGALGMSKVGFPILIRIGELEEHIANCLGRKDADVPATAESADWPAHFLAAQKWDLPAEYFDAKMHDEQTVVMLDGLDETPDTLTRERMARLFENATQRYAECRFVVTTRPGAYQGMATLAGFEVVTIDDLADDAVTSFLKHWSAALFPGDPDAATKHQMELLSALHGRPAIRRMARNPVMLTALAVVHWNERRMPEQRAELYESILGWLARAREKAGRERAERCLTVLGHLALAMLTESKGRAKQVAKRRAAELIAPQFRETHEPERLRRAERFLEQEEVDSGIVVSRGSNVEFWHLTFQEHLAGRAIAGLTDAAQQELLFGGANLYKTEWRETFLLYAGLLMSKQGPEKVDALVALMLNSQGTRLAERARCAGLLGAVVADLRPTGYELRDAARYHQLLADVMEIFERERSEVVPLKTRIEAAEALGQAGDPRLRQKNWITIPAGTFVMGDGADAHEVELNAYQIGKYPVTVEEYGKYVEEGGSAPRDWESQTEYPNRPVVNVSWHDAEVYCQWAGLRLPTEAEWERAARGAEGRTYPWGEEEPDPSRANYDKTRVGRQTPIGLFPRGATPEGICDMAGNVWEWVADWYGKYPKEKQQNPKGPSSGEMRVLRGGAWDNGTRYLRGADRVRNVPEGRYNFIGFRCSREVLFH